MSDNAPYVNGQFCWVDLTAHDAAAAKAWYADVFGWAACDVPNPGGPPYSMFSLGLDTVAGLGQMNDEMKSQGAPPTWNSYVQVADAAATLASAEKLGARVIVPVQDVGMGKLAYFLDPGGACFAIWEPAGEPAADCGGQVGTCCWNELMTRELEAVKPFYAKLFGWSYGEMDMGGGRMYTTIKAGDADVGGIMGLDEPGMEGAPSAWVVYLAVADADGTAAKIEATGGGVMSPPMDIPPGRFAMVADPQGAAFGIIKLAGD